MKENFYDFQFSPIHDFNYSRWFQEWGYNNIVLTDSQRKDFASLMDRLIEAYSEGLPLFYDELDRIKDLNDEFHEINRVIGSITLFELITTIDCMAACKYFVIADKDYDRRYMRGKLRIILNEGFKKLYGFTKENYKKSEWARLDPIIHHFPDVIKDQHKRLSLLLKRHSESTSWWKNERDLEVHMDAKNLFLSRTEDIIDSKVIMEFMKLFDTLSAVSGFLTNAHACLCNTLVDKYYRGELVE